MIWCIPASFVDARARLAAALAAAMDQAIKYQSKGDDVKLSMVSEQDPQPLQYNTSSDDAAFTTVAGMFGQLVYYHVDVEPVPFLCVLLAGAGQSPGVPPRASCRYRGVA